MIALSQDYHHNVDAMKSSIEQAIAAARENATSGQLADIYDASVLAYSAAEFWADNIQSIKFKLYGPDGNIVDPEQNPDHPLIVLLKSPEFSRMMRQTELTMRFWGYSLSRKRRNGYGVTRDLRWVNPFNFTRQETWRGGLKGFEIRSGHGQVNPEGLYAPSEVVYFSGFSFENEHDGVSSAEVAFYECSTEPEIALTRLSLFRNLAIPMIAIQPAVDQPEDMPAGAIQSSLQAIRGFFQRTYKGAINFARSLITSSRFEYQQLTMPHKDVVLTEQRRDIQESIAQAFRVNVEFFTTGQTTFAELDGKYQIWLQRSLKPRAENYGHMLTDQLCKTEFPGYSIRPDLSDVLREDEAEKVAAINAKLDARIITLYRAQELAGETPEESFKDVYIIEGVPVPLADVRTYWRYKLNVPPEPLPAPTAPEGGALSAPDAGKAVEDGKELWIGLDLANNPDLIDLQASLKSKYPTVEWTDRNAFHVTLIFVRAVNDEQIGALQELMQGMTMPTMALNIGSVNSFGSPTGQFALHFQIRSNSTLYELQRQLYDLCVEAGMAMPTFSREYIPHVTMGTSPVKIRQTFKSNIKVAPQAICLDVDRNELIRILPGEQYTGEIEEGAAPVPPGDAAKSADSVEDYLSDEVFKEIKVAVRRAAKGKGYTRSLLTEHTWDYIQVLTGLGIGSDRVVRAAKKHYIGLWAAKALTSTKAQFKAEFNNELDVARHDEVTRRRYVNILKGMRNRYGLMTLEDGIVDGGVDLAEVSDETKAALMADEIAKTDAFIVQFVATLFTDGLTDAQAAIKAEQWWVGVILPFYYIGVSQASKSPMMRWKMDPAKENCKSCKVLNGQVHALDQYQKYGFIPGSGALICGPGKHCGCNLEPAPGAKASGRLAAVPYVRGRKDAWGEYEDDEDDHEHHHDHDHEELALGA